MKNTYSLSWTHQAEIDLESIISYLEFNFSEKVLQKFLRMLNEKLEALKIQPNAFPSTYTNRSIKKLVLSKQTSLFYQLIESDIYILTLQDNRKRKAKYLS